MQFLETLIHTENTRQPITNVYMVFHSLICVVHFSNDLNSVFHKKVHETYCCSSSVACQEQIGYLEYSLLMIKIHYISP